MLGALSALAILIPFAGAADTGMLCLVFSGVIIGTLLPDVDAERSAILSRPSRSLGVRGYLALPLDFFVPALGQAIRWLVYLPSSCMLKLLMGKEYEHRHRGILHSVAGAVLVLAPLSLALLLVVGLVSSCAGRSAPFDIILLAPALLLGYLLHLLQDSCTRGGVAWFYPFSTGKLHGDLRTGVPDLRIRIFTLALGTLVSAEVISIAAVSALPLPSSPAWSALLAMLWGALLVSCGVRWEEHR